MKAGRVKHCHYLCSCCWPVCQHHAFVNSALARTWHGVWLGFWFGLSCATITSSSLCSPHQGGLGVQSQVTYLLTWWKDERFKMLSFVRLASGCVGQHIFLVCFSLYCVQFCEQESVTGLSYVLVCYCLIISVIMVPCLFQVTSWLLPDHLRNYGPMSFSGYKLVTALSSP